MSNLEVVEIEKRRNGRITFMVISLRTLNRKEKVSVSVLKSIIYCEKIKILFTLCTSLVLFTLMLNTEIPILAHKRGINGV